tara:strand:+ start:2038 stop:2652 length:615 start_codon:yes stop_codon:yes gene_type:complete
MIKNVTILDYDASNIFNLLNLLKKLEYKIKISNKTKDIEKADRLIIPGVGAFGEGMKILKKEKLIVPIKNFLEKERPLLGICLGMQYFLEYSEEFGKNKGLEIIKGNVKKFPDHIKYRVPHVGWNLVKFDKDKIFNSLDNRSSFYFTHSFYVKPRNKKNIIGTTNYSKINFCSVIKNKYFYGCQFHPERSGKNGIIFLKNFMNI